MSESSVERNDLDALEKIYQEMTMVMSGFSTGQDNACGSCTDCCHHNYRFPVGSLELEYMQAKGFEITQEYVDFLNGRIHPPDGSLPLCPHSTPEGCGVYEARPMCCRIYGFSPYRDLLPGCVYKDFPDQVAPVWEQLPPLFGAFLNLRREHYIQCRPEPVTLTDFLDLGGLFLEVGELPTALAHFQKALALNPKDPRAHFSMGEYHSHRQEGDKALIHYHNSLELDPSDFNTHVRLGGLYQEQGKWDTALDHYTQAREMDPKNPVHWMLAGSAHFALEQLAEAKTHMEKVLTLNPDDNLAQLCRNYLKACDPSA